MAHPNVDILRESYEAFARGDIEAVTANWTDDIVWHIPGRSALAGDKAGKEAILETLGRLVQLSEGTFALEVVSILADDDYCTVLCRSTATMAGQNMEDLTVHVHRMRDGKACESWFLNLNQAEEDELLAEAERILAGAAG